MDVVLTRRTDGPIEAYVAGHPELHACGRDMDELRDRLQRLL